MVYDKQSGHLDSFVNGQKSLTANRGENARAGVGEQNRGVMYIGLNKLSNGGYDCSSIDVDEILFWNRVLTDSQVQALYNSYQPSGK